ncbi:BTAD domain-containing putative transcriptional regulator [Anaerorhabdus sp.]|uniref:BTAD domain-containing putative transcriptional regulator n=1 Tax=Anaerorhabdus sp. TaxID=1872524 RepID=UPI002FC921C4
MNEEKESNLDIKLFGNFQMQQADAVLTEDNIRSEMSLKLLAYILCHRDYNVLVSELSEALWEEDESDNPVGALKNLMYRLRSILKETFGRTDFILTNRGSYAWNKDIKVTMDIETFEKYYQVAKQENDTAKKIAYMQKCVTSYQGTFLSKLSSEHWVIRLSTYYHSSYLSVVKELADLYKKENDYKKVEELCNKALALEHFDEQLHFYLIEALIKQEKKQLAIEQYRATTELFYAQFGTKPSKELKVLYQEMLKQKNELELDLEIIQEDLDEAMLPKGAFYCEYGEFKKIYNLQARQAKRLGISVYCGLITLKFNYKISETSELYLKSMSKAMDSLHEAIDKALRVGDVVARYSMSQFVILLPTCAYETSVIVMERIKDNFIAEDVRKRIEFVYDVKELTI